MFVFFKQKTAYELRISDWSSDVCSSDLQEDEDLARAVLDDLFEGKQAVSFLGTPLAQGEQAAEPTVGGAVGRKAEQLRSIRRHEAGADEKLDLHLLRRQVRAHHAGQRVAVGDGDRRQP